jgi:type II secretory pathway component PulF
LRNGVPLPEAIQLTEQLETSPAAAADLREWQKKLAGGVAKFSELAAGDKMIPPMFAWIVSGSGENLTDGFKRAAEIYHTRAIYRTEVALFSVLPMASVFLGAVVISQAFLVISMFLPFTQMISNLSG